MMESVKPQSGPSDSPTQLAALAEKCDGPDQFNRFDKLFRAVIAVPKTAIDKEEAGWKKERAREKRAKKPA